MDPKETAQSLMNAIQGGNFDKAKSLLTDDFVFRAGQWRGMAGRQ